MHFFDANNPTLVNRLLVREGKQKVYTPQAGTRLFVLLAGVGMFKWAATKHRRPLVAAIQWQAPAALVEVE